MKTKNIKGVTYKIIPEANRVTSEEVWWLGDLMEKDVSQLKLAEKSLVKAVVMKVGRTGWLRIKSAANCDSHDEFNEDTGIAICAAKNDMKRHGCLARRYTNAYHLFAKLADVCRQLADKHAVKEYNIKEDLENYYGGDLR